MKPINIKAKNFKPNIRILENYIITFEKNKINLFNFSGDKLDKIKHILLLRIFAL